MFISYGPFDDTASILLYEVGVLCEPGGAVPLGDTTCLKSKAQRAVACPKETFVSNLFDLNKTHFVT